MRLASLSHDRIGLVDDEHIIDITDQLPPADPGVSAMRRLIRNWDGVAVHPRADAPTLSVMDTRFEAPIPDPTKIMAAPVNYRSHQTEMREEVQVDGLGLFLKAPSSIQRPGGTVYLPYHDRRFDQEGELACVIGRRARRVSVAQALQHVFGYTALLDITMRGGEDRSTRKSFNTFAPMGPWLVTADEIGTPDHLDLRCSVNDELRQNANTGELIWDVAHLVSYASWVTTLEPGDVIATGTPAGVGPIHDGDTIEVNLSGLGGRLRVGVSAAGAVASHTRGHDRGPTPPPSRHPTSAPA